MGNVIGLERLLLVEVMEPIKFRFFFSQGSRVFAIFQLIRHPFHSMSSHSLEKRKRPFLGETPFLSFIHQFNKEKNRKSKSEPVKLSQIQYNARGRSSRLNPVWELGQQAFGH